MSGDEKDKNMQALGAILEEAELDRIAREVESQSPEEIEAELAQAGYTPERVRAMFESHEKLAESLSPRKKRPSVVRSITSARPLRYLSGGAFGGLALAAGLFGLLVARGEINIGRAPTSSDTLGTPPPSDADKLRAEAFKACGGHRWAECLKKLDEAKLSDPQGEVFDQDLQTIRASAVAALAASKDGGK